MRLEQFASAPDVLTLLQVPRFRKLPEGGEHDTSDLLVGVAQIADVAEPPEIILEVGIPQVNAGLAIAQSIEERGAGHQTVMPGIRDAQSISQLPGSVRIFLGRERLTRDTADGAIQVVPRR